MTGVDGRRGRYCIIGAGPSGLAAAAAFRRHGVPYDQLERHTGVGGLWDLDNPGTAMYASAHLISSRTKSSFFGFPMPEDYPDYPKREQVLEYLRAFARKHELESQIEFGQTVERVERHEDHAVVVANGEARAYRGVVCASGLNWDPLVPEYEGRFDGELRHAVTYKRPSEFEGKRVVIIGLGNSGADIACDAVHRARSVVVSTRRGYHFIPKFVFGKPADVFASDGPRLPLWIERPIFAFLQSLLVGDVTRYGMPKPDHAILQSHPLVNDQLVHHLQHGDVRIKGAVRGFSGSTVQFADGTEESADLVLMATGYSRRIAYLPPDTFEGDRATSNFVSCFNPKAQNLFTIGFVELNGALYPHLSRLSDLTARVALAQLNASDVAARFYAWVQTTHFDKSGGRRFIDSYRHAHYHDDRALTRATQKAFKVMGWDCPAG